MTDPAVPQAGIAAVSAWRFLKPFLLILAATAGLAASRSHAAIITWTDADWLGPQNEGGGAVDSWSDPGNWSSDALPTSSDTVVFNTGINDGTFINTVFADTSGLSVGNILFDSYAYYGSPGSEVGYTIEDTSTNTDALTLGISGTIGILSTFAGTGVTQTISVPLLLSGSATFGNYAPGNTLLLSGSITAPGVTSTVTLSGDGLGTISGNIGNGSGGTVGVLDNSTSSWTLSGNNTYTGGTIVNSGTLVLTASNNFGSGTLTVNSGAVVSGSANDTFGGVTVAGGAFTMAGAEQGTGGLTVNGGGSATLNGADSFSGGISVSGGTVALSGAKTFTGNIVVNSGTLSANVAGALGTGNTITLSGGGEFRESALISTFANNITLGTGGGVFSVFQGSDFYTGTITGSNGLTVTNAGDPAGQTYYDLVPNNVPSPWNLGTLTITGSGTRFVMLNNYNAIANNVSITVNPQAIFDFGSGGTYSGSNPFSLASGSLLVTRTGGTVTLNTSNVTFPSAGSMIIGSDDTGGGSFAINGTWPTLTGNLAIDISQGGASTPVTFNNGFNLGSNTLTIGSYNYTASPTANTSTFAGAITGSGGLTKIGSQVTTLSANNTYSGPTTISGGTVKISGSGNLGDAAATNTISLGGAVLESTANSYSLSANQAITLTGASTIQVDAGTLTLPQDISGAAGLTKSGTGTLILSGNNTYTGALTLAGGVTNATNAALNASGATAGIIFATGTLQAGAGGISTGNTVDLSGAGTFDTQGYDSTFSGIVYGAGALTILGNGQLTLSNPATIGATSPAFSGGLTILSGTVQNGSSANANALGTGGITFGTSNTPAIDLAGNNVETGLLSGSANALVTDSVAASNTLTLAGTGSATFQGVIQNGSGTVGLTILSGAQTLSGTNTYSGATTLDGGALIIDTGTTTTSVINPLSPLVLNSGSLQLVSRAIGGGTPAQTFNGTTISGDSFVNVDNLVTTTTLNLGTITRVPGGAVDFQNSAGSLSTDGMTGALVEGVIGNDVSGILGAWATVNGGAALATQSGTNNAIVAFTGYTVIGGATNTITSGYTTDVEIGSGATTVPFVLGSGTTSIDTLTQNTATANTVNDAGDILRFGTTGGILVTPTASSAGTLTIGSSAGSGVITAGGNTPGVAGELILNVNAAAALTVNSDIADNYFTYGSAATGATGGIVTLTKSGSGTAILDGANTFTGPIYITGGVLKVYNDTNLGGEPAYTSSPGGNGLATTVNVAGGPTIYLNGGALDTSLSGGQYFSNPIVVGPAGGGINESSNNNSYFIGTISGSGPLTIDGVGSTGAGTVHWDTDNASNFTGPIILVDTDNTSNEGLLTDAAGFPTSTTNGITFTATASGNGAILEDENTPAGVGGPMTIAKSLNFVSNGELFGPTGDLLTISGVVGGGGEITVGPNGTGQAGVAFTNPLNDFTGELQIFSNLYVSTASLGSGSGILDFNGSGAELVATAGGLATSRNITAAGGNVFNSNGYTMTLSGVVSSNGAIVKTGAGLVDFNGASANTWTGNSLTVNAGTLEFDFTNLGAPTNLLGSGTGAGTTLILSGGTLDINGKPGAYATSQTLGNLTISAATSDGVTLVPNGGTSTTLVLGNTWTRSAGGTLLINESAAGTAVLQSDPAAAETGGIIPYALVLTSAGTEGWATVSGSTIVLYNDEGGTTFSNAGNSSSVNYTTFNSIYTSGTLGGFTGSFAVNSLAIDTTGTSGTIDLGGAGDVMTLTSGALLFRGPNNETIQDGQVGASGSELILSQIGSGVLNIAATISGGSGSLTVTGTGTTILSAANTYTGATTIDGGTLQLGIATTGGTSPASGALGINSAVTVADGATLNLNGYNTTIGSLAGGGGDFGTSASVLLGSGTLTVGGNYTSTTYDGTISGAGGLFFDGYQNSLTLGGANTYTGPTIISGPSNGAFSGNASIYGLVVSTLANGGQASSIGASSSAASNLVFEGGGAGFEGSTGYGLNITENPLGAELEYTGTTASTNRNFTIAPNSMAVINITVGTTTLTMSGDSAGAVDAYNNNGGLYKLGPGTLDLTGLSTFGGVVGIGYETNPNSDGATTYGGTLSAAILANAGLPSSIGAGGNLIMYGNTDTFQYMGPSVSTNMFVLTFGNVSDLSTIQVTNPSTDLTFTTGLDIAGSNARGALGTAGPGTVTIDGGIDEARAGFFVESGTTIVNSVITETSASGSILIDAGATMGGDGSDAANAFIYGTLYPGAQFNSTATGIFSIQPGSHNGGDGTDNAGDLNVYSGGTLEFQLSGTAAGAGYSQITTAIGAANGTTLGAVTFSGEVNLGLNIGSGFTPISGNQFTLVNVAGTGNSVSDPFATLNGVITNLNQGAVFTTSSDTFQISYRAEGTTFDMGSGLGNNVMIRDVGTDYWSNGATGGSWSNVSNFTLDGGGTTPAPVVPFAPINVVMTSSTATTPLTTTLDGSYSINSLTFTGSGNASSNLVTINPGSSSTNTLTINAQGYNGNTVGNGITVNAGSDGATINAPLVLGANQSWTVNSGPAAPLTVNGNVTGAGMGLTLSGTGTVVLAGTDGYTGATNINAGTLSLTGTLGSGGGTAITSAATFNEAGSGVIAGSSSLSVNAGITTLAGANTYTGLTTVRGGTLQLNFTGAGAPASNILLGTGTLALAGGTLNVNSAFAGGSAQSFASLILNPGGGAITMTSNAGTGDTLTFTNGTITHNTGGAVDFVTPAGTNVVLSGNVSNPFLGTYAFYGAGSSESYAATDVNGNVIAATPTAEAGTGVDNFNSATTNYVYNSPGATDDQLNAADTANTALFNLSSAQVIDIGSAGGSNTLTLNGILNAGAPLTIQRTAGTGSVVIGSNNELVIGGTGAVTISAPITGAAGAALTDADTGSLTLSGVNTFTGPIAIGSGTLTLGGAGQLNGGNDAANIKNQGAFAFNSSAGQVLLGTISGIGAVTENGVGALTLSGPNTYSGGTTLTTGTLIAAGSTATTGGAIASGPFGTGLLNLNGGTFEDNGTAVTIANSVLLGSAVTFASTGSGSLNFNGSGLNAPATVALTASSTLTVNNTTTISDPISGVNFGIVEAGTGTLNLFGLNTYSGNTTLNAGTMVIGSSTYTNNGVISSGPVGSGTLILNGGTFEDNGTNLSLSNSLSMAGNVTFASTGNGSLTFNSTGLTTAATATVTAPLNLTVNNTTTINRLFTGGSYPLTVSGTGTLNIAAINGSDTVGPLTINSGATFEFTGGQSFNGGTYANPIVDQGTFTWVGSNQTLSGIISGTGMLYQAANTLVMNAANTYSGGTVLDGGSLTADVSTNVAGGVILNGPFGTGMVAALNGSISDNGTAIVLANSFSFGSNMNFSGGGDAGTLTFNGTNLSTPSTILITQGPGDTGYPSISVNNLTVIDDVIYGLAFTKGGGGTLILSGANVFIDGMDMNGGTTIPTLSTVTSAGIIASGPFGTGLLTLNAGTLEDNGSVLTLANPISITGSVTFAMGGAGTGGFIFNSSGLTTPSTVALGATPTLTVNDSVTINDVVTGAYGITKAGVGTLTLTGTNTYTGNTTLSAGTLVAGVSTVNSTIISSGPIGTGTLTLSGGSFDDNGTAITLANPLIISGSATFGSTGSGSLNFNGTGLTTPATAVLTVNPIVTVNNTTTIADVISGSGFGITKAGPGSLVFSGANTYSGATTVNAGTLELNFAALGAPASNILLSTGALALGGGTLNMNSAGTGTSAQTLASLTLNGGISTISMTNNGAAADNLTFTAGTITRNADAAVDFVSPASTAIILTGNNSNAFLGDWAFFGTGAAESYAATSSSGSVIAATPTTTSPGVDGFSSASTNYVYSSPGATDDQMNTADTANTALFNLSTAQVIDIGYAGGSNTLTLNGILNAGAPLTIQRSSGTGTVDIGSANELVLGGTGNIAISAPIIGTGGALTDANTGTVTLSGANSYTGATTLDGGTLVAGVSTVSTTTIASGPFGLGTLDLNGGTLEDNGSAITLANSVAIGGNVGFATTGGGSLTFNGNTLTSPATVVLSNTPTLTVNNTTTIDDAISGTGGFVMAGTGDLILAGTNTFTGGLSVTSGTVTISAATNVNGSNNTITLSGGATFDMTTSIPALGAPFILGAGGGVFISSGVGSSSTYPFLTGAVTGGGGMTVAGGDIVDDTSTAWNIGTLTITNGARFLMYNTGAQNALANGAVTNVIDGGELDFGTSGSLTPTDIMNFASGTYLVGRSTAVTINIGYASFPSAGTMNIGSDDVGGGSYAINGAWPTLTGPLTIDYSEGPAATPVTFNNSFNLASNTLTIGFVDNPFATTFVGSTTNFAGIISGSGGINKNGGATTLSAANTFTGTTVVTAGTLTLANSLALQDSVLNYNNQGGAISFGSLTAATLGGLSGAQALPSNSLTSLTLNTQPSVSSTYTAVLANSGGTLGLTVTGAGAQTLTANETYTGPTTVNGSSTLIVSGSITGSTVTVAHGATLASGNNLTSTVGNASNPLTVDGTLSPGGSGGSALTTIGELTTGPLTLGTTGTMATLVMELGGTSAGTYDQIAVTSGSALNLTDVTLQASLVNGYTPATGDLLFLIIDAGSVNGTFADAAGNQIVIGNEDFDVSYTANFGADSFTGGDDVALLAVAAVPEPDTWMLLFSGIGILAFWHRSRRLRG